MLQEQVYTLEKASSISARQEQYKGFLRDVLGAEINLIEDGNYFWLDENKNCGFAALTDNSNAPIYAAYKTDNSETVSTYMQYNMNFSLVAKLAYQVSKNKNVVYLSMFTENNAAANRNYYIIAKDEKNIWHIFSGLYIFGAEGQISAQGGVAADTKALFIASKAIAPDGAKFLELNRLLFATSFEISSTLVAFDGVPHRVVSVDGTAPCFTFPVSEE